MEGQNIENNNEQTVIEDIKRRKLSLLKFLKETDITKFLEVTDEITGIARQIEKDHPDARNYQAFHDFIGSTPHGECPKFDFPDDDGSIIKIMAKLEKKYMGQK